MPLHIGAELVRLHLHTIVHHLEYLGCIIWSLEGKYLHILEYTTPTFCLIYVTQYNEKNPFRVV